MNEMMDGWMDGWMMVEGMNGDALRKITLCACYELVFLNTPVLVCWSVG
jgi:hypothetical protein